MSERGTRRGVFAVTTIGVVAAVFLLLGHDAIQGYLGTKSPPPPSSSDMPSSAGVAGVVTFADGTPAPAARIDIAWTDSGGRPGETPAMTDDKGRFTQPNVPAKATLTRVVASLGPLTAESASSAAPSDAAGSRVRIALPATFRLAGLVRRVGDRAPVAGAKIEIGGVSTTSGPAGEFKLDAVPASVLRDERPILKISADGLKPMEWPLPKGDPSATYGDLSIQLEPVK